MAGIARKKIERLKQIIPSEKATTSFIELSNSVEELRRRVRNIEEGDKNNNDYIKVEAT